MCLSTHFRAFGVRRAFFCARQEPIGRMRFIFANQPRRQRAGDAELDPSQ